MSPRERAQNKLQANEECDTWICFTEVRFSQTESRLGGVNRAKLKFSKIITTTSRVSVRNIIESAREDAKQIASK
jgi:hypothetical protein